MSFLIAGELRKVGQRRAGFVRAVVACLCLAAASSFALDFTTTQVADDSKINREPVISETGLIAWYCNGTNDKASAVVDINLWTDGERRNITEGSSGTFFGNIKPQVQSNKVVWVASFPDAVQGDITWQLKEVPNRDEGAPELPALYSAHQEGDKQWLENLIPTNTTDANGNPAVITNELRRHPSGLEEICYWEKGATDGVVRITRDYRHDFAPSVWGNLISWQVEKGWPFGWEIMAYDRSNGQFVQLTTNFYYDMAPKVHGDKIVWYGWDGHDFEIYMYDHTKQQITQITSNQYDDVSPQIWGDQIVWEGYPSAESDIFIYRDGKIEKLSDNIEDDFNPRIWNGKVIWQGFDGDDFEIYYYDPEKSPKAIKVTNNLFDDTNPDLKDGLACWMGYYQNWDAEIFVWDGTGEPVMITDNEYEDRDPHTAGGKVVWQSERDGKWGIYLASPK